MLGRWSQTGNALNTITPWTKSHKTNFIRISFFGASQLRHSWNHSSITMPKRKSTASEAPVAEPPRRSLRNAQPASEPVAAVKEVKKQVKKALPKGGQKTPQKVEEESVCPVFLGFLCDLEQGKQSVLDNQHVSPQFFKIGACLAMPSPTMPLTHFDSISRPTVPNMPYRKPPRHPTPKLNPPLHHPPKRPEPANNHPRPRPKPPPKSPPANPPSPPKKPPLHQPPPPKNPTPRKRPTGSSKPSLSPASKTASTCASLSTTSQLKPCPSPGTASAPTPRATTSGP